MSAIPITISVASIPVGTAESIYTPTIGKVGTINSFSIIGPVLESYNIMIYKQLAKTNNITVPIISFQLNPGDTVQSDTKFALGDGDSWFAIASIAGVVIVLNGEEI